MGYSAPYDDEDEGDGESFLPNAKSNAPKIPMNSALDRSISMKSWLYGNQNEILSSIKTISHYTTLRTFVSIVGSGEFWLSHISRMNDFEEVVAAARIVNNQINENERASNGVYIDYWNRIRIRYNDLIDNTYENMYLMSFSETNIELEMIDILSMWVKYGGNGTGITMLFNRENILLPYETNDPLIWIRMNYRHISDFSYHIIDRIQRAIVEFGIVNQSVEIDKTRALNERDELFIERMSWTLFVETISHKHVGYIDEKEYRLVFSPFLRPRLHDSVVIVDRKFGDDERKIARIKLEEYPTIRSKSIALKDILYAIMLGPTCLSSYDSVRRILDMHGLNRVKILHSSIPYRNT